MPTLEDELLSAFDGHNSAAVQRALEAGADPTQPIRGKLPVDWLLEEYARSDRLGECLTLLRQAGAELKDPAIVPIIMDDGEAVASAVRAQPECLRHRTTLTSAFTPLVGATLLHVAAEYGNARAARALIDAGADVNAKAAYDEFGLNGHTPLFHTVHSHANRAEPIMRMLLDAGASVDIQLAGITWGKGYPWETTWYDVTPISYAQLGLLPQVHRNEQEIFANVQTLLTAAGRKVPSAHNVPNRYLLPKSPSKAS